MTLAGLPETSEPSRGLSAFFRMCLPSPRALVLALLTCVVVPAVLIALHVHENPAFSPIDEWAHYDYVDRIAAGELPRLGELVLPSTLRTMACQGVDYPKSGWPACNSAKLTAAEFGTSAYSYEAQQPPTYYAVTAAVRWVPLHLLGMSQLTATRLTGIFWLVLGLVLFWGAGSALGLDPTLTAIGALLLATAPVVLYESSAVSNNATAVPAGSLILLVGTLAWRHRGRWSVASLACAGFVVCTLDLVNALPVVAVAALFALLAWSDRPGLRGSERRSLNRLWLGHAAALLVGAGIAVGGWLLADHALTLINPRTLPSFDALRSVPVAAGQVVREAVTLFAPLTGSYVVYRSNATGALLGSSISQALQAVMSALLELLLLAGIAWLFARARGWSRWVGLVTVPTLYLGGIVLGLGLWITYDVDPGLSGRYGLALAPLLVLALVGSLPGRWAVRAVGGFAIVSTALSVYFLLG